MKTTMDLTVREAMIIASWQNLSAPQEYNYEESIALGKKITSFIKDNEVKPCPFCGSYALFAEDKAVRNLKAPITLECQNKDCGVDIGWYDSEEEAREAWNRRA